MTQNNILFSQTQSAAKFGVWNGLPRLAHDHTQSSAANTSVDLALCECRSREQVHKLAITADVTFDLQLGRAEVLRGLRNCLNMDRPKRHSFDCLEDRRAEKGSGQHSTLQGLDDLCSTRQTFALF